MLKLILLKRKTSVDIIGCHSKVYLSR